MNLIISKVMVIPLMRVKDILPELEAVQILNQNCIKPKYSKIVLFGFKRHVYRWKPLVGNRVSDIQSISTPEQWGHFPGKCRPSDLLIQWVLLMKLQVYSLW